MAFVLQQTHSVANMGINTYNLIVVKELMMPTICYFYGIMILMHLTNKKHNPPHIHATYGDYEASFYISNGEIYEGEFPNNGKRLVKEFILEYSDQLLKMWETGEYYKLPAIK